MKITNKIAILALAAICLMVLPAPSNHWDRSAAGIYHGGWMLLADDLTEEKINNMTPAEIEDLKEQKMQ
jgi:hypothetical protein